MAQSVGLPVSIGDYRPTIKDFSTCLDFRAGGIVKIGTTNPFSSNFYFTARVKWYGNNATFQHIFSKRDSYGASTMMFDLYIDPTTNEVKLDNNVSSKNFAYILPKFKWVTITWVHNTTDSLDQLFIDGVRVSNQASGSLGTGTTALVSIGAVEAGASEPFNGKIDEVVIGNPTTAPTWTEVVAMHAKYVYPTQWSYLKFDEGSGSSATDSSGNSNTGTITTATYSTDRVMGASRTAVSRFLLPNSSLQCGVFDGSNGKAVVPIAPSVNGFSFGIWVYLKRPASTNRFIFSCESASNTDGFKVFFNFTTAQFTFSIYNSTTLTASMGTGNSGVKFNQWVYLSGTFKTNEAKFFVNNVQSGATDTSCSMSVPGTFQISKQLTFGSTNWLGRMARFTFQNTSTPWTTAQLTNLYYRNEIPSGAVQWSFNNTDLDQNGANQLTLTSVTYSTDVPPHMRVRTLV